MATQRLAEIIVSFDDTLKGTHSEFVASSMSDALNTAERLLRNTRSGNVVIKNSLTNTIYDYLETN